VVIKADHDAFEEAFWSMFDDLAKARQEATVAKLLKDKPALGPSMVGEAKRQAAAARKNHRDQVKQTTYGFEVSSLEVPSYDTASNRFAGEIAGVIDVGKGWLTDQQNGWTLSFGLGPTVRRESEEDETKLGNTLVTFKYRFQGGRPTRWTIPMPPIRQTGSSRGIRSFSGTVSPLRFSSR
jgi:hypothetical protein